MVTISRGEVYKAKDGWRFRTVAGNGEKLAYGEAYANEADCRETLAAHLPAGTPIVALTAKAVGATDPADDEAIVVEETLVATSGNASAR